jgi:hypothetical protein
VAVKSKQQQPSWNGWLLAAGCWLEARRRVCGDFGGARRTTRATTRAERRAPRINFHSRDSFILGYELLVRRDFIHNDESRESMKIPSATCTLSIVLHYILINHVDVCQ